MTKNCIRLFTLWIIFSLLIDSNTVWALDSDILDASSIRLTGFTTIGLTYHDNHDAGVITSFSQRNPADNGFSTNLDSVLGLQLDWNLLQDTSLTLQGLSRTGNNLQPEMRMGYLQQQLGSDFSARIGRFRIPVFLDSDAVDIGYAYTMVRQPTSLYHIANSVGFVDGGDVQWNPFFGNTGLSVQAYYGQNKYKHRSYAASPVAVGEGDPHGISGLVVKTMLPNVTLYGGYSQSGDLTFRSGGIDRFNTAITTLSANLIALSHSPVLSDAQKTAIRQQADRISALHNPYDAQNKYISFGIDTSLDAWRLLGEWIFFNPGTHMVGKHEGFHLMAAYSVGNFTPYISLARLYLTGERFDSSIFAPTGLNAVLDAGLAQIANATGWANGEAGFASSTFSLGVRWDFRKNMALKAQYDRIETPNSMTIGSLAVYNVPFDNELHLFSIALDIVF